MVIKCNRETRGNIFKYTKNLKGQKNALQQYHYVDPQLPEVFSAEKAELNYQMQKIRVENEGKIAP